MDLRRLERALTQPMSYSPTAASPSKRTYTVNGSSGTAYAVTIGLRSRCSCPDEGAHRRKARCKHQLLVLLKDLGVGIRNPILISTQCSVTQLNQLFDNTEHPVETGLGACRRGECSVCLVEGDLGASCSVCCNAFHDACIVQWRRVCSSQGIEPTCPLCRRADSFQ
jgi:hypothetical protein